LKIRAILIDNASFYIHTISFNINRITQSATMKEVENTTLETLKLAAEVYKPLYDVAWCEVVGAFVSTFINPTDEGDKVEYMFNSREVAEETLLELAEVA